MIEVSMYGIWTLANLSSAVTSTHTRDETHTSTHPIRRILRAFSMSSYSRSCFKACIASQRNASTATSFFCRSCVMYRVRSLDGTLSKGSQAIVHRREGRASRMMAEKTVESPLRLCSYGTYTLHRHIKLPIDHARPTCLET